MMTPPSEAQAHRRLFYGLAALAMLMFAVDSSIITVALGTLIVDLDTTLAWAGWTLTGYALAQIVAMPVIAKLAEQFGQMRVFVICMVVFTVGSLLCGLAANVYMLIGCRVLQAIGGGGIMPSAVSIIARLFPESRSKMLGLFTSIFPLGGILGPNIGGLLLEHFSWRVLFLVNVPIGLVIVPLLARQIAAYDCGRASPAGGAGRLSRRLDIIGAALFAAAFIMLLMALTFAGRDPAFIWTPMFWTMLVVSGGLLLVFGWHERRAAEPIIDLDLVTRHPFLLVNIQNFLFGACVWGGFAFMPYFAAVQYGMGPFESGAIMTPRSITAIALGTITSFMLVRTGYRLPIIVGLSLIAVSNVMLSQGWTGSALGLPMVGPFLIMGVIVGLCGIGTGLVMPSSNNAMLDLLPDRAGVISGMRGMCRSTGGIVGTALIVVMLELHVDKAAGLRQMFLAYGLILVAAIPLTVFIPEAPRPRSIAGASPPTAPAVEPVVAGRPAS